MNCCVVPWPIAAEFGDTEIEVKPAGVTVKLVEPTTEPDVALMRVVPVLALEANPVADMAATLVVAELHVAVLVRF